MWTLELIWGKSENRCFYPLQHDAELMDTGLGYRIWYLVLDEYYGTVPGVDVIGYSAAGEIVYKYE